MSDWSHSQSRALGSPLMTMKNELFLGAVVRGELPTVRRLLDRHRADINSRNSNGLSCLQLAILCGHTKLAEYLIQKGVDIHMVDPDGHTALHDASLMENHFLVHKLISKGLSPLASTRKGELAIDLAGSVQVEELLCEEMCRIGEVRLAREYYVYLGLGLSEVEKASAKRSLGGRGNPPRSQQKHPGGPIRSKSSPQLHVPPPKVKAIPSLQTECQVSKNYSTHEYRLHPSAKNANSALQERAVPRDASLSGHPNCQATTKVGRFPNHRLDNAENHRNSAEGTTYKGSLEAKSQDSCSSSGQSLKTTQSEENCSSDNSGTESISKTNQFEAKSSGTSLVDPSRESVQEVNPKSSREAAAIKSLYQHSGFQLQIGLSLHSGQYSSLDNNEGEDFETEEHNPGLYKLSQATSPSILPRKQQAHNCSTEEPKLRNLQQQQSNNGKNSPRQRDFLGTLHKTVSFADLPMTRTKAMYVGHSSSQDNSSSNNTTNSVKQRTPPKSRPPEQHRYSLPSSILDHFITKYSKNRENAAKEDVDSPFDAGIRALRMKPQKSIIRRASEGGRRRSVTFQPEVLLQEIVTDGDLEAVSEILESGIIADVNKMSPSGLTALHQSAIDGNLECAKALVAKGANVNCMDCEKWTPLHAAVMNGSIEFVRFLLASGAKPHLKNDNGETAYDMSKNGPIRKMLLHAMNGKSLDADDFSDGEYSGEEEEEEYSHAESESDDDEGEGASLFDSNGEQKSLKERLGLTHSSALNNSTHTNSISPSPDLDNVFTPSTETRTETRSSTETHCPKREQELTDSTSSYGSLFGPEDRIKELDTSFVLNSSKVEESTSKAESDTDKVSESGISTMEGSSDCSHRSRGLSFEEENYTLDSDLDPNSLDYEFQEACLYCDVDKVLKLVKYRHEIDINRVNKGSGITALHHSVLEENFALVQHLVKDFEADLHIQDTDGWYPLHAASAVGNIQIAQFLLDRGAKPSNLNHSCEFPVDIAEDEAMEKLLKNAMLGQSSTEKCLKR